MPARFMVVALVALVAALASPARAQVATDPYEPETTEEPVYEPAPEPEAEPPPARPAPRPRAQAPRAQPPRQETTVNEMETTVIAGERERQPSTFEIVGRDTLYGGATGLLVGGGLLLVTRDWDDWGNYFSIGAGSGILIGAAVGVVDVVMTREERRERERVADPRPAARPETPPNARPADEDRARTVGLSVRGRY